MKACLGESLTVYMGTHTHHTKGIEEWGRSPGEVQNFLPLLKTSPTRRVNGRATTLGRDIWAEPQQHNAMSDAQRASILRPLQASDIWMALRLPANAAADVVRQAFRKESRLLHPDKNPMPEAEAQASHSAPTACTAGPARTRLAYI